MHFPLFGTIVVIETLAVVTYCVDEQFPVLKNMPKFIKTTTIRRTLMIRVFKTCARGWKSGGGT